MTSEAIPITRAQHYISDVEAWRPHGARVQTLRDDGGIVELALDHLTVDHGCVRSGAVTIAAGGPDPNDAFGYEFDLEPEAACRLAAELVAAAHAAGDLVRGSEGVFGELPSRDAKERGEPGHPGQCAPSEARCEGDGGSLGQEAERTGSGPARRVLDGPRSAAIEGDTDSKGAAR